MPEPASSDRAGEGLTSALAWLDTLLARAAAAARELYGPEAAGDPYRGLLIGHDQPARLLAREPGLPLLATGEPPDRTTGTLATLRDAFELSELDVAVCVIALAPELDLRYERLYGYLQDDVARRRATVDLALNLLCASPAEKLERRARFAPTAPLIRHGVIELVADPRHAQPPRLARYLKLDEQLVGLLAGDRGLGERLVGTAELIASPSGEWPESLPRAAVRIAGDAAAERRLLTLWIEGAPGSGRARAAAALAAALGSPLLELDGARGAAEAFAPALRYARFTGAVVHVRNVGEGAAELLRTAAGAAGPVVLSGTGRERPDADLCLRIELPDGAARGALWRREVEREGLSAPDGLLDALADRFRLSPGQIAAAAAQAGAHARLGHGTGEDGAALIAAARAQGATGLGELARRVQPVRSWPDLVLPPDRVAQLRELCDWLRHRTQVHQTWGFRRTLGLAAGLNALFSGPPGTGKTLAAEVVAGDLGLDLYRIDLATVVSKYIGETEKNLARVFDEAQDSNAILLFDEADALFGKRSEVRDAHDRYANIEISYLLQRMEEYDGVAILTTNRRRDLDEAFARRLQFVVEFPLPDADDRRRIWEAIWPEEAPIAPEVDLELIARRFELPGGNIRNIAVAAAFAAAADGQVVTLTHLVAATRREYRKLGTLASEGQFDVEGWAP